MKKYTLSALAAAGLMAGFAGSASAADLGGNCCADLEERIAELEATTARKGNRKVSLTVSGWVGQQVTYWNDGVESNTYVHDLGSTLGSNVKFTGQATISPGWSAGYVQHIELMGSDSLTHSADDPSGAALYAGTLSGGLGYNSVQTIQSYWFVKSEQLGKVSVGLLSQASDNTAILVDGSGSLVPANWVAFDVNSFAIRNNGGVGITWGGAGSCRGMGGAWGDCNGLTQNSVRYDSPTFGGFSVSASWGADDFWDVAARYAGEFSGFKLAAAVAYNEVTDNNYNNIKQITTTTADDGTVTPGVDVTGFNGEMTYFQAGIYLQHVPTGLFALYNYGQIDDDFSGLDSSDTHYVKAGIRQRWSSLGHSVLYGEYLNNQDGASNGSELDMYGAGIVQEVDAAAMSVWLKYRHLEFNDSTATSFEDFDDVGVGQ